MTWLRRIVPAPLITAALWASWLMLNESLSIGHALLGLVLAIALPWWTERFRPEKPRLRNMRKIARLSLLLAWDIVVSNIDVARRVLGPEAALRSVFVWVPLTIRDPHGIAVLAGMVTLTPGTLSSELTPDTRYLLVHTIHSDDEAADAALVENIKTRYEQPLMEIFA